MTAYDQFAYPRRSYAQTHPTRLGAMARLMGLKATHPSRSAVLELGCGDGTNLLAMAASLPTARFVGIDLAETSIKTAKQSARELGLSNIEFRCADVATFRVEEFPEGVDYILAHGLYSWIPEAARASVLDLCRSSLCENGVAYISYNALPGCHLREMTWRMMRYHVRHLDTPAERVQQGRALLHMLVNGRTDTAEAYHKILEEQLAHAREYNESAFFHDDLSEVNAPVYFHEFIERAGQVGLQFLGESDLRAMNAGGAVTEQATELLRQMEATDILVKEQYLDFLTGRRFRQTLLCRSEVALDRRVGTPRMEDLWVAGELREVEQTHGTEPGTVHFEGPKGASATASHTVLLQALRMLAAAWPQAVGFPALAEAASSNEERDGLARFLYQAAGAGAVEFRLAPSPLTLSPGPRPEVSAFARWQSTDQNVVTTLIHTRVHLGADHRSRLVHALDGSRTPAEVAQELGLTEAQVAQDMAFLARAGLLTGPNP